MQAYIATVKILVAAPSPTDACDVISAALATLSTPRLLIGDTSPEHLTLAPAVARTPRCAERGQVQVCDRGYIPTANGTGFAYPEPAPDIDLPTYVEGSFISPANPPYSDL